MEGSRQRRVHQACEPCRRKKVKCPGQRPTCSFCQRLGQPCNYSSGPPGQRFRNQERHHGTLGRRMEALEDKLDQVLRSLDRSNTRASPTGVLTRSSKSTHSPTPSQAHQTIELQPIHDVGLPIFPAGEDRLVEVGQLYQKWCHNQPLCLFRQEDFPNSVQFRDQELQLAIQTLTCRFPPGHLKPTIRHEIDSMSGLCRKLVMEHVANSKVKLSTLQTLCLLSMACFADGDVMQAGLDLAMASYFASCLPAASSLGDPLECSLCIQSISLLQCLQASIPDATKATSIGTLFRNSSMLETTNHRSIRLPLRYEPGPEDDSDRGILFYMSQAAEVWHMARIYAAAQVGSEDPPPWEPQSDYSIVMLRNLELDCRFPLRYRFAKNNFGGVSPEALHQRRDYWGPWLFIQFIHAAIPTLINHPFLLSMRLKNFRHMMPQTFMHQSFDHISRHTAWTICFLDLVETQNFQISDPSIAHCVVVVATIHLQHSFVEDDSLRKRAQDGYDKCMRFLDRMGSIWPFVFSMTQNLRKLEDSITTVPPIDTQSNGPHEPHLSWSIDAQLLWDILIYEKAGRRETNTDKSMFDGIIDVEDQCHESDVAEFSMVGTAGISGHKTAWKEISAYAPEDNTPRHQLNRLNTPIGSTSQGPSATQLGGVDSLTDLNMINQGDFFLQAEDYGRAIHDWFNFDMTDPMYGRML
ncbi:hypothetical protein BDV27DRAFT_18439 [Aspergillus caelatus]|uniref:Zn(2)-C6 fungal-type domain-containing protein n=1 Tax=Aspergillus caelatus TaxID=61420 RepID=A0A5N6ZY41_9EURO|nr:uncharacterized protein BDV27DRAFT_18439 [Aspergillus caelatus]KAE8362442.1 hypothetical protein BDV27DRAFT_18439 [Aspergillus caelatus]